MTDLYLATAVMAFLAGLRAMVQLYRERSRILAASALSLLASSTALTLTALNPALLQPGPTHAVITWVTAILGLVAAWTFLGMLAAVTGKQARTATHPVILPAGAILGGLVQVVLHAARWLPGLPVTAVGLVLPALCCPALGGIAVLAWRCSSRMPVKHIKAGMRAVAAAAVSELVLILAAIPEVMLTTYRRSEAVPEAINMAQGVAVILFLVGVTVPAWFPAVTSAFRQYRAWAAWCRLRPLWALLLDAVPDVHLPAQPGTRRRPHYRLHRRVIEIRDAELALRPFMNSRAARDAACAAHSAGLPHDKLDAVIEAVMIVTALDALRDGTELSGGADAEHAISEPPASLQSETERLLQISRAVRRSPIVRQAARATQSRSTNSHRPE